MQTTTVKIHAKINLSLRVVGLADNGYHYLDMLVLPVENIFDIITVARRRDDQITCTMEYADNFRTERMEVPHDSNTAVRAAKLLQLALDIGGLDIHITKGIPFMAGLGGSSADAAGVIVAVCELFQIEPVQKHTIQSIALKCGADVQLQMTAGLKRARGFGEQIEHIPSIPPLHIVVAKSAGGVKSNQCFPLLDQTNNNTFQPNDDNTKLITLLQLGNLDSAIQYFVNDLQPPAIQLNPDIQTTLDLLRQSGALIASMTGSGSACFGIYKTAEDKTAALEFLRDKLQFVVG
jgi:4-diphosphocytidyl-2-C-methyl-D-erythritol kinase